MQKPDLNLIPTEEDMKVAEEVVDRAKKGNHSKFEFIRSWAEHTKTCQYIKACSIMSRQFEKVQRKLMKDYRRSIMQMQSNLTLLLTALNCETISSFYHDEAVIAKDMRREYWSYVWGGHFLDSMLGVYREDDDLVDYRTLPTRWFWEKE